MFYNLELFLHLSVMISVIIIYPKRNRMFLLQPQNDKMVEKM